MRGSAVHGDGQVGQEVPIPILHQPDSQSRSYCSEGDTAILARGDRTVDMSELWGEVVHAQAAVSYVRASMEVEVSSQAPGRKVGGRGVGEGRPRGARAAVN